MRVIAIGKVDENGKLILPQRNTFNKDLSCFKGKDVIITVENKTKRRSLEQNKYYWGVIIPLVKQGLLDNGYRVTTESTHEYLKSNFSIIELVNEHNGEILKSIGNTSNMTTVEMMDYFAKIMQWSAEYLNVIIPEPNQQLNIFER